MWAGAQLKCWHRQQGFEKPFKQLSRPIVKCYYGPSLGLSSTIYCLAHCICKDWAVPLLIPFQDSIVSRCQRLDQHAPMGLLEENIQTTSARLVCSHKLQVPEFLDLYSQWVCGNAHVDPRQRKAWSCSSAPARHRNSLCLLRTLNRWIQFIKVKFIIIYSVQIRMCQDSEHDASGRIKAAFVKEGGATLCPGPILLR